MRSNEQNEYFRNFLSNPNEETFKALLEIHPKEEDYLDFKERWIDDISLGKSILGFANTQGGAIIFGIEDGTNNPKGLGISNSEEKDKDDSQVIRDTADVGNSLDKFLPKEIAYQLSDISCKNGDLAGKTFQVIRIRPVPHLIPFFSQKDSETPKRKGKPSKIAKDEIYVRRATKTEKANHADIKRIINERVEAGYSLKNSINLKEHLKELEVLYNEIAYPPFQSPDLVEWLREPKAGYYKFLSLTIKEKEKTILSLLKRS